MSEGKEGLFNELLYGDVPELTASSAMQGWDADQLAIARIAVREYAGVLVSQASSEESRSLIQQCLRPYLDVLHDCAFNLIEKERVS